MCGLFFFLLARIVVLLYLGVFYGVVKTLVTTTRLSTLLPVPPVWDIASTGAQCLIFEYQRNTWEM
jgi:hypothetical protein